MIVCECPGTQSPGLVWSEFVQFASAHAVGFSPSQYFALYGSGRDDYGHLSLYPRRGADAWHPLLSI